MERVILSPTHPSSPTFAAPGGGGCARRDEGERPGVGWRADGLSAGCHRSAGTRKALTHPGRGDSFFFSSALGGLASRDFVTCTRSLFRPSLAFSLTQSALWSREEFWVDRAAEEAGRAGAKSPACDLAGPPSTPHGRYSGLESTTRAVLAAAACVRRAPAEPARRGRAAEIAGIEDLAGRATRRRAPRRRARRDLADACQCSARWRQGEPCALFARDLNGD